MTCDVIWASITLCRWWLGTAAVCSPDTLQSWQSCDYDATRIYSCEQREPLLLALPVAEVRLLLRPQALASCYFAAAFLTATLMRIMHHSVESSC
jgi:hypothetical protein